jgi:type I pantothenate kinase
MAVIKHPDSVIVEGLNVLQTWRGPGQKLTTFVSDFFDFSLYVDADEQDIKEWYVDRFLTLRRTAFRNPSSYFHRYSRLTIEQAREIASEIWDQINGVNLRENIAITRERADLILEKSADHCVQSVRLRKL